MSQVRKVSKKIAGQESHRKKIAGQEIQEKSGKTPALSVNFYILTSIKNCRLVVIETPRR